MQKVYGVIGSPVRHSMSPAMHNDAFEHLGIPARYNAFHVEPKDLREAVLGMKALGIAGFNVTIPHKVAVMEYLDEIDAAALDIGAVNTVVNVDGRLIGFNTDGLGYLMSLKTAVKKPLAESAILMVGAGGAARGIFFTLLKESPRRLDICNRTLERAEKLILPDEKKVSKAITLGEAEKNLGVYDIIINTTSIGMSPKMDEIPLNLENLRQGAVVSDIIYNPLETRFLKEAALKGAATLNGVGMFVYQGALAFEKWTGKKPDIKRMETIVYNHLGGTQC